MVRTGIQMVKRTQMVKQNGLAFHLAGLKWERVKNKVFAERKKEKISFYVNSILHSVPFSRAAVTVPYDTKLYIPYE